MTLVRLLVIALLCLPVLSVGQEKQVGSPASGSVQVPAAPPEPWRIFPKGELKIGSSPDPLSHIQSYQVRSDKKEANADLAQFIPPLPTDNIAIPSDGSGDTACFAIRSYVVARDCKDSDSTHPVGYSTCRPASRYHVKTVEGTSVPQSR